MNYQLTKEENSEIHQAYPKHTVDRKQHGSFILTGIVSTCLETDLPFLYVIKNAFHTNLFGDVAMQQSFNV